jgi:hypothetical protein
MSSKPKISAKKKAPPVAAATSGSASSGPWKAIDNRDGFGREVIITTQKRRAGNWSPICEMDEDFTGPMGPEQVANKHLIVAAPDLLECLIHLADRDWYQSGMTGEVICGLDAEKVRNALSKALGQNAAVSHGDRERQPDTNKNDNEH